MTREAPWRHLKKFEQFFGKIAKKKRKMRILKQSHSAEKLEGGDRKNFEKSSIVPKNIQRGTI